MVKVVIWEKFIVINTLRRGESKQPNFMLQRTRKRKIHWKLIRWIKTEINGKTIENISETRVSFLKFFYGESNSKVY
jgi:hypothetical protein